MSIYRIHTQFPLNITRIHIDAPDWEGWMVVDQSVTTSHPAETPRTALLTFPQMGLREEWAAVFYFSAVEWGRSPSFKTLPIPGNESYGASPPISNRNYQFWYGLRPGQSTAWRKGQLGTISISSSDGNDEAEVMQPATFQCR